MPGIRMNEWVSDLRVFLHSASNSLNMSIEMEAEQHADTRTIYLSFLPTWASEKNSGNCNTRNILYLYTNIVGLGSARVKKE